MFPSTISITVAVGNTIVLNRVNQDNYGSEYQFAGATESAVLKIRHTLENPQKDGRRFKRHNVFFEHVVYPTPTADSKINSMTLTMRNLEMSDPAVVSEITKGVEAWIGTGTNRLEIAQGAN